MATNNATNTPRLTSNGQLMIGSVGVNPVPATLTAGTNITITNGPGSITIDAVNAGSWVDQGATSVTMTANTGYTANAGASLITFTLPTTAAVGDFVEINGKGSGLYVIAQTAGQSVNFGSITTTVGAGGSISSILQFDCIRLRCITANTTWDVVASVGNFNIV